MKTKRILSLIVSLLMVFSLISVGFTSGAISKALIDEVSFKSAPTSYKEGLLPKASDFVPANESKFEVADFAIVDSSKTSFTNANQLDETIPVFDGEEDEVVAALKKGHIYTIAIVLRSNDVNYTFKDAEPTVSIPKLENSAIFEQTSPTDQEKANFITNKNSISGGLCVTASLVSSLSESFGFDDIQADDYIVFCSIADIKSNDKTEETLETIMTIFEFVLKIIKMVFDFLVTL